MKIIAKARGFSLVEVLLVVGLLAVLLVGVYQIFDNWLQRAVNRQAAIDTLRLQQAAADYVYANFDTISTDQNDRFVQIPIATLTGGNYLPNGYTPTNAFRQFMRVYRRSHQDDKKDKNGNAIAAAKISHIDVLVIGDINPTTVPPRDVPVPNERLFDAAAAGGAQMGVYTRTVDLNKNYNNITSIFNDWEVDVAGFKANTGYARNPVIVAGVPTGGYLAAFKVVSGEGAEPNSDYLYRVTVPNRPDLNQMQTDLYMNSNPIENVTTLVADKVSVTGNVAFMGNNSTQALSVEQALQINGGGQSLLQMVNTLDPTNCTFTGSGATRTPAGNANACGPQTTGGELQVVVTDDSTVDATMGIGTLNTSGNIISDKFFGDADNTGNAITTVQGASTFENIDATSMTAAKTVTVPFTRLMSGTLNTQTIQIGDLDVYGSRTIGSDTGGIIVNNVMYAPSVIPGPGNTVTADNMRLDNTADFTGTLVAGTLDKMKKLDIGDIDTAGTSTYTAPYPAKRPGILGGDFTGTRKFRCRTRGTPAKTFCEQDGGTAWPAYWRVNGAYYKVTCDSNGGNWTCTHGKWNGTNYTDNKKSCTYTPDTSSGAPKYSEVCS